MPSSPPRPPIDDLAPDSDDVTPYDLTHFHTYRRLAEAEESGANWRSLTQDILGLDPATDELRARRCYDSHLARAHWLLSDLAFLLPSEPRPSPLSGKSLPLQPPVADHAPQVPVLTKYDWQHIVTYLRLLDAEADGADWREAAKLVLHLDPAVDESRAQAAWRSHLARAHWISTQGVWQM